jgi:anti-sigma factor RsiW
MDPLARRELLGAYLDGELSAEASLHVSTWLDEHPQALREVEHLRHVWDLLEAYEDEPVPPDFAAGVLEAVGLGPAAGKGAERARGAPAGRVLRMAWYRRPVATAAAVLLAVGVTALVMSRGGEEPQARPTPPTDVVSVLKDVPDDELGPLLLNADVLLSVDDSALDADYSDETLLGG